MAKQIKTDIKIWNFADEALKKENRLVIEFKDVIVDTGSTRLVLPKEAVERLNLLKDGEVTVRYADERRAKKWVARGVGVEIMGRCGTFDAVIEDRPTPLIGMVVLEELDLWPDPINGRLTTNPESPDMPLYNLLLND